MIRIYELTEKESLGRSRTAASSLKAHLYDPKCPENVKMTEHPIIGGARLTIETNDWKHTFIKELIELLEAAGWKEKEE